MYMQLHILALLYESTGRVNCSYPSVGIQVEKLLKFLVKVFISLYLLNLSMDLKSVS